MIDAIHVSDDWERRLAAEVATIDSRDASSFVAAIDRLAAELPAGHAVGLFERGGARDSTGQPDLAVPLYRAALEAGLAGLRRRRAVIQMASSIRNLGDPEAAVRLLQAELLEADDTLTGAVRTFLALALADVGREREAIGSLLLAIAPCLPRYNRSVGRYAEAFGAPASP